MPWSRWSGLWWSGLWWSGLWWSGLWSVTGVIVVLASLTRALDYLADGIEDLPEDWAHLVESLALLFDLGIEGNVPTLYATVLLLLLVSGAAMHSLIGPAAQAPAWRTIAVVAALLAIDEATSLHERFLDPLGARLGAGDGLLPFAWVLPGGVIAVVGIVMLARVTGRLDRQVRASLGRALIVFFAGAVVGEVIAGVVFSERGVGPAYQAATTVEESLELTGVLLALRPVLRGLEARRLGGSVTFGLSQTRVP